MSKLDELKKAHKEAFLRYWELKDEEAAQKLIDVAWQEVERLRKYWALHYPEVDCKKVEEMAINQEGSKIIQEYLEQFLEEKGYKAMENFLIEELGFELIETRRTYQTGDGSEVVFVEGIKDER